MKKGPPKDWLSVLHTPPKDQEEEVWFWEFDTAVPFLGRLRDLDPKKAYNWQPKKADTLAEGLRYDAGKPRYDLIPPEALDALAELYRVGATIKYAERNWEKGMSWQKCYRSLLSHANKWQYGEDFDQETGAHHMTAAAWNAIALLVYHTRQIGTDDRTRSTSCQPLWIEPTLSTNSATNSPKYSAPPVSPACEPTPQDKQPIEANPKTGLAFWEETKFRRHLEGMSRQQLLTLQQAVQVRLASQRPQSAT